MKITAVDVYIKSKWSKGQGMAAGIMVCYTNAGEKKKLVKAESNESRTKMILELMVEVLSMLRYACTVAFYVEDMMIRNAIENKWWMMWEDNNWKKSSGQDVVNKDTWEKLAPLLKTHDVGICKYINTHDKELNDAIKNAKEN